MKWKTFFLDYDERNEKKHCVASKIRYLGGKIEAFLNKKVNFIVTINKQKAMTVPCKKYQYHTRAISMLVKSQTKAFTGSSYICEIAKKWNIRIFFYEDIIQDVILLAEQLKGKEKLPETRVDIVKKLKPPFIKVQDRSGLYRPYYKDFETCPTINLNSVGSGSPFDNGSDTSVRKGKRNDHNRLQFCECCNVAFSDLKTHLSSEQHQNFAKDSRNYVKIDTFIKENGLDLKSFMKRMYEKHNVG